MKEYITIDIGGTTIKHGVLREDLGFIEEGEQPTLALEEGGPGILRKLKNILSHYVKDYHPAGICISTAGIVDSKLGRIQYASPLIPDYTGIEMKDYLEEIFDLPCEMENDVNCAALAEYHAGAAKGSQVALCLTIGTGIGGAVIINGEIFKGASGSGCEVGYLHLPGGSFQKQGATSALVRKVANLKNKSLEEVDGRKIFQWAKEKDPIAVQAIDEMCQVLGMGIANISYVLNPDIVVLGGGIMAQKSYLEPLIRHSMEEYLIRPIAVNTRLAFAQNENRAGMLGAYFHFLKYQEKRKGWIHG
ncbi:MAG: ROK family protein [Tissierellia bacterium]|nr:ROK family protein [Tissierellia bacterium]